MAKVLARDLYGPKVAARVPAGWQAPEYRRLSLEPLTPTIGAEVSGVDLGHVDDELADELHWALTEWKVLFFRDQQLDREAHAALVTRDGEVIDHPFAKHTEVYGADQSDTAPGAMRFVKGEKSVGIENFWHHDMTFLARPPMVTALRALEVPPVGGDTLWADMAAAHDCLPEDVCERIADLWAEHDWYDNYGRSMSPELREAVRPEFPAVRHPVVARHPVTGRRVLFVTRAFTQRIIGLSETESDDLLEMLWAQADRSEYQCRFRWQPDSVAIWDNRACQHYAVSDYAPQRRVMERISGDGPPPSH